MNRIVMPIAIAALLMGCETLDVGRKINASVNQEDADNRSVGAARTDVATTSIEKSRGVVRVGSANSTRRTPVGMSDRRSQSGNRNVHLEGSQKTEDEMTVQTNATPAEGKPVDIANIENDKEFFEALKKVGKTEDRALLKRGCKMKDETLLIEFVQMYPSQAKPVAELNYHRIKNSKLAELLIDNIKDPLLNSERGWETIPGIDYILFDLAKALDATARAKYLARAKKNREQAVKDGVLVLEKFYIGMPVIDYVMISLEDNLSWTKKGGAVIDWLDYRADMKTDISGKDWRIEWKIEDLSFVGKERYKYFKVKGTYDGLLEFAKKYLDKSAKRSDITINDGWWQYMDEEHGIKAAMNDNNGALYIVGIE